MEMFFFHKVATAFTACINTEYFGNQIKSKLLVLVTVNTTIHGHEYQHVREKYEFGCILLS